tara:strand:- start:81 stop:734 length:654 start_codon:yes stop_codon:yes gene_type:complete
MSIKEKYTVKSIAKHLCKEWLLHKHYAKRMCSISYSLGLFDINNVLQGICTFGFPPNYNYNNGKCVFNNYKCLTLELNRLVVNDNLPNNCLSYFVSNSLNMLPKPSCIVSYADQNQHHNGYIYQATNWIYTGTSTPKHKYVFEDGSSFDIRRGLQNKGKVVDKILMKSTHRYLYFNGTKKDKKTMRKSLKMKIESYPKGQNKRYDSSYKTTIQKELF